MPTADDLGVDDVLSVVTELFGIEGHQKTRQEFYFLCPVHEDHDPSASVNLKTGLWNCWVCKGSGDLAGLGALVLSKPRKTVLRLLRPNEPDAMAVALQRRVRNKLAVERFTKTVHEHTDFTLRIPEPAAYAKRPLKAFYARGFTKETAQKWEIRYVISEKLERPDDKPFEITHAIGIPIRSEHGNLIGWCYRATKKSERWFREVRYIYTPGIQDTLSKHWFGLHLSRDADAIVVCEGAIDAMWLDQCGYPAVAILGSNVKQTVKLRKLLNFRKVILFPDRDEAGLWTTFTLGESLTERGVATTVCRYQSFMKNRDGKASKDPNELAPLDVELVIERAIPFVTWKQRNRLKIA